LDRKGESCVAFFWFPEDRTHLARHQIILLIARDGLLRKVTVAGLETYGYDVLVADDSAQAAEILRLNKGLTVLITDADLRGSIDGLAIAHVARELNPRIDVIYTSRMPHQIVRSPLVWGAPVLRDPYHSHQLVGVLSNLRQRSSEATTASAA
jgi:DNA-binding response OmpR family regulator